MAQQQCLPRPTDLAVKVRSPRPQSTYNCVTSSVVRYFYNLLVIKIDAMLPTNAKVNKHNFSLKLSLQSSRIGRKPVTNIEGDRFGAKRRKKLLTNISLWGCLFNMHMYVHSHYIQYNDKLISYKRSSNLLSSAQSILNPHNLTFLLHTFYLTGGGVKIPPGYLSL